MRPRADRGDDDAMHRRFGQHAGASHGGAEEGGLAGTFAFARVGAVVAMRVEDYFPKGKRWWVRLHEKGGKRHEMPAHHTLEAYLDAYIEAAKIRDDDPYIRGLGKDFEKPTVKQYLAAIRMLFDWLVTGQVVATNPAHAVRGPKHVVKTGKTTVLTSEQARELLDSIDVTTLVGLRGRLAHGPASGRRSRRARAHRLPYVSGDGDYGLSRSRRHARKRASDGGA